LITNLSKPSSSVGRAADSKFHVKWVWGSNPDGKFVFFKPHSRFLSFVFWQFLSNFTQKHWKFKNMYHILIEVQICGYLEPKNLLCFAAKPNWMKLEFFSLKWALLFCNEVMPLKFESDQFFGLKKYWKNMPGRGLNPRHLHGRQLCLPHNHGVNHYELHLKMLCRHPLELLSFFGNFAEFFLSFKC